MNIRRALALLSAALSTQACGSSEDSNMPEGNIKALTSDQAKIVYALVAKVRLLTVGGNRYGLLFQQ